MANTTKQLAKELASVPIFSKLTAKHRMMLADLGKTVTWKDGKEGVKEGSNASAFFYIVSGTVSVTRKGKKVATLNDGDFFGELALLTGGKRTATVTATSDTELFAVGRGAVTPVIRANPDFAIDLIQAVARRFAEESS